MRSLSVNSEKLILILITLLVIKVDARRRVRRAGDGWNNKVTNTPELGEEVNLATIEGIEKVTKLVFIKTDSLPEEYDETVNGRYLNSLMETLYTGLRKPFKSVSADILGIFPTFEEIEVRCEKPSNENLEKDESIIKKRDSTDEHIFTNRTYLYNKFQVGRDTLRSDERLNETISDGEMNYFNRGSLKSPIQVCQAVTGDCLSMENLVQILPQGVTTFDKALVRLCPVLLFRIMNHLCHKQDSPLGINQQDKGFLVSQSEEKSDNSDSKVSSKKDVVSLNTLLRETQMLRNLQNSDDLASKKPQKLHKKLKTQGTYTSNGRLNAANLNQRGSVDEQLLKIRLKLTEPSIEKVWIFSLLFVILSIVVSMGGLIVLPFVRKTTRRRILTLFEGLAVGGLAGSATLHMFPQAFGLVDENYRKYFWRIFFVFLGIYLCYLCERIIKILKVMRARVRRRSRASLIDSDFRYGFSVGNQNPKHFESSTSRTIQSATSSRKTSSMMNSREDSSGLCPECKDINMTRIDLSILHSDNTNRGYRERAIRAKENNACSSCHRKNISKHEMAKIDPQMDEGCLTNSTKQHLIHCLRSVQEQFSPVFVVTEQTVDDNANPKDGPRINRFMRLMKQNDQSQKVHNKDKSRMNLRDSPVDESNRFFKRNKVDARSRSEKKYRKKRDIETMLYHQEVVARQNLGASTQRDYLQQRLSSVNDVAAERQDQDNAARMSVDTVAWMIVFGDAVLNVIDGLSIGAAFERNILAGISISVAVMLEEVTHRLGTFAVLIRAGMSMQQSLLCTFLSACALFPGLIVGILLSDATEDATPYIFCAAGGIFLYMALVDVMKEMNRSIENAIRKDLKSTLQIFALQNIGIIVAVIFLSFLALYEQAMDFEEYQMQYNQPS